MSLLRKKHIFSFLNRKYKAGEIKQQEFLEEITNALEKKANHEFTKVRNLYLS